MLPALGENLFNFPIPSVRVQTRVCLERAWIEVETAWGSVRVKIGREGDTIRNVAPEFDDCRRLARSAGVPVTIRLAVTVSS